jgi:hypothetical protein
MHVVLRVNCQPRLNSKALRREDACAVDAQTQVFLTSAVGEGEWSASRPGRFIPGE